MRLPWRSRTAAAPAAPNGTRLSELPGNKRLTSIPAVAAAAACADHYDGVGDKFGFVVDDDDLVGWLACAAAAAAGVRNKRRLQLEPVKQRSWLRQPKTFAASAGF